MPSWLSSQNLADLVIAVTLLEGIALLARRHFAGRGPRPADVLALLAPGLALMSALRLALTGGAPEAIALCLALAGGFHLIDLARRWPKRD